MRRFTLLIFLAATNCCAFFTILTFYAVFAAEERSSTIPPVLAILFYAFRFPAHNLLFDYFKLDISSWLFLGSYVVNCLMYGLLIERLITFYKQKRRTRLTTRVECQHQPDNRLKVVFFDVYVALSSAVSLIFTLAFSFWAFDNKPFLLGLLLVLLAFFVAAGSLAAFPALFRYLSHEPAKSAQAVFLQVVSIQGLVALVGLPIIWLIIA